MLVVSAAAVGLLPAAGAGSSSAPVIAFLRRRCEQTVPTTWLDELGLIVLPLLLGGGMQLTPSVSTDTRLTLARQHALPSGAVELVYACA